MNDFYESNMVEWQMEEALNICLPTMKQPALSLC